MSSGMQILAPTEQDIRQMIAARVHLGDTNADHRMMHYVHSVSQLFFEVSITICVRSGL